MPSRLSKNLLSESFILFVQLSYDQTDQFEATMDLAQAPGLENFSLVQRRDTKESSFSFINGKQKKSHTSFFFLLLLLRDHAVGT